MLNNLKNKLFLRLVVLFLVYLLCACSATNYGRITTNPRETYTLLHKQYKIWKGTPYRMGGISKQGIDCSGFTMLTYKQLFNINLPRTTSIQARIGTKVSKRSIMAGDLVFFKTGRGPNGYHVGIYMANNMFLHASSETGVTYSSLNSGFYRSHFWQARRL